MSNSQLPERASLEYLKKLAKERLQALRRADPRAACECTSRRRARSRLLQLESVEGTRRGAAEGSGGAVHRRVLRGKQPSRAAVIDRGPRARQSALGLSTAGQIGRTRAKDE